MLGNLVHDVFEELVRNRSMWLDSAGLEEAFEEEWSTRLSAFSAEGNDPSTWADYRRARLRAFRRLSRLSGYVRPHDPEVVKPERDMASPDGKLYGRVDLLVQARSGTEIVDYKTGATADLALREKHARQLRLYAGMELESTGAMPVAARILSMSASWYEIPLDEGECRDLMAEARRHLEEFDSVAPGPQQANPGPDACRTCTHAIDCAAFWGAVRSGWLQSAQGSPRHALVGLLVDEPIVAVNGNVSLRLEVLHSTAPVLGEVVVTGLSAFSLPAERTPTEGSTVRIVGLSHGDSTGMPRLSAWPHATWIRFEAGTSDLSIGK